MHECEKLAISKIMTRICEIFTKKFLAHKWISLCMASVNDHYCSLCQECDVQPLFKCLSFTKVNVHWYGGCSDLVCRVEVGCLELRHLSVVLMALAL